MPVVIITAAAAAAAAAAATILVLTGMQKPTLLLPSPNFGGKALFHGRQCPARSC
jgi:hypothetical protein